MRWKTKVDANNYEEDMVGKAIHLFRNPLDNIVSRYHHERNRLEGNHTYIEEHPNNRQGFLTFCADAEKRSVPHEGMDESILQDLAQVPCYADLYRYIRWHELAASVADDMDVPTLDIFYEDYGTAFDDTLSRILAFLELDEVGIPATFRGGEDYDDFYTKEEREAAFRDIRKLASPELTLKLSRYLSSAAAAVEE